MMSRFFLDSICPAFPVFFGSGKFVMVNWTTADVWVVVQFGQGMESADNETQQIEFVIFPRIRFKI